MSDKKKRNVSGDVENGNNRELNLCTVFAAITRTDPSNPFYSSARQSNSQARCKAIISRPEKQSPRRFQAFFFGRHRHGDMNGSCLMRHQFGSVYLQKDTTPANPVFLNLQVYDRFKFITPFIAYKFSPLLIMSDAPAAIVTENGVPPVPQVEEAPAFKVSSSPPSFPPFLRLTPVQVFAGNLAYTTTDEGLKAFFAPVQNDMYVAT